MENFRYKDIDLNMTLHPMKKDVMPVYDAEAVKRSLKNLILISIFERKLNPWAGSLVYTQLFENITPTTQPILKKLIENVVENYEPRVELKNVVVNAEPDQNFLEVFIIFRIINLPEEYNLTIRLERLR
ncbi:MAG: GPW/gp25 family protein [Patescibacteria group bacterium]|nr:GPW/gp25 family protein [Patescibacteria group bacterium]